MALTVVDHPLAATMLTALRDATTPPPLFRLLLAQQKSQVGRGAELPLAIHLHQIDATPCVNFLKLRQQRVKIAALR